MAGLEWQKMAHIVTAQDLRINLDGPNEDGVFRWFIASFLMGKRLQRHRQQAQERHSSQTGHVHSSRARAHVG
jgi:hypothetical protein